MGLEVSRNPAQHISAHHARRRKYSRLDRYRRTGALVVERLLSFPVNMALAPGKGFQGHSADSGRAMQVVFTRNSATVLLRFVFCVTCVRPWKLALGSRCRRLGAGSLFSAKRFATTRTESH